MATMTSPRPAPLDFGFAVFKAEASSPRRPSLASYPSSAPSWQSRHSSSIFSFQGTPAQSATTDYSFSEMMSSNPYRGMSTPQWTESRFSSPVLPGRIESPAPQANAIASAPSFPSLETTGTNFTISELSDSESDDDSGDDIMVPDTYEDVDSDAELSSSGSEDEGSPWVEAIDGKDGIVSGLEALRTGEDEFHAKQRERRQQRRKNRMSAGLFKRTHAQSIGSEGDADDEIDANNATNSPRRTRRRVGPKEASVAKVVTPDGMNTASGSEAEMTTTNLAASRISAPFHGPVTVEEYRSSSDDEMFDAPSR